MSSLGAEQSDPDDETRRFRTVEFGEIRVSNDSLQFRLSARREPIMKNFGPGFGLDDGFCGGVSGIDGASWFSIRPIWGLADGQSTSVFAHSDRYLPEIWADYDGTTDLKRRVEIFIIGSSLAFWCSII
ncbi:hypothetical protein [Halorarum halobium]|uniref:hypothetical protein n=1 Tax=Halorarum halobium TaxID=3075121 RepID=UPI0028A8E611|nr:hypothetical protein [Halobaculum sp. XH14]